MAKRPKKRKALDSGGHREIPAIGPATPQMPSWFKQDWFLGLILVLAVILAYQPVWYAGFIWDDAALITANPCIVGPLGLKEIWTTSAAQFYPLVLTAFWLEHAIWGLTSLPYHLVNIFLHGACAVLLWRVLRSLQVPGAWLGAALWALHPVQVDSVAWIAEMKNTQSGVFFLLSILFFVRWLRVSARDSQSGPGWNYALSLLFATLAMASKSSTVVLPVILGLCAWWVQGRWRWRDFASIAPFFLLSIASTVLALWTVNVHELPPDPFWPASSIMERFVIAGDAVWFYLGKLFWPYPLLAVYPRWPIHADQPLSYLPLLAVIVIFVLLWSKRDSWARPCFFAFACFLVALLPALGLVDNYVLHYCFVADHFQYLASMAPLALAGAGLSQILSWAFSRRPWLQPLPSAGLLLTLGVLSWTNAWTYQNDETLWPPTLARNPDCWLGLNNLGLALFQEGQVDEAMGFYERVLELNPRSADAFNNLGSAFLEKGQTDEAITQYKKALEIDSDNAVTHYHLGNVFFQKGQMNEAIEQYQKAVELNPNFTEAHSNLGSVLFKRGQVDDAMVQWQKALEIDPTLAGVHNNFGMALFQKGRVDEAIAQFQMALQLNPGFSNAQDNLANAQAMVLQKPDQK